MSVRSAESLRHCVLRICDEGESPDDALLLKRLVTANDRDAFELLIARHGPMVLGTARRLVNEPHDAEDVFQAVFLSFARLAKSIRQANTVPAWLHKTTCRIAAKARKNRVTQLQSSREPSESTVPEAGLVWREVRVVLDEELQRLPERLRLPLLLCYVSGLARDEAAKQLGWSLGTLKRRLEQGRKILRTRLERRGIAAAGLIVAVLTPQAMQAAVTKSLVDATLGMTFSNEPLTRATVSVLVLHSAGTINGLAMKSIFAILAAVGIGVGLYAGAGQAEPPKKAEEKRADPPPAKVEQKSESATDRNGDPLPEGAIARLGSARWRHGGRVQSVTFGPDGKTLASASWDGSVRVWEAGTGRELATFPERGHGISALGVAYAPNGKILASCDNDKAIHLWDVATHKEIRTLLGHEDRAWSVAWAPDGQTIASASYDKTVRIWDPATGKELHTLRGHQFGVQFVAYAPDGKTLASAGCDNTVRLWDAVTGKELRTLDGHGKVVESVAFAPDGKILASASMDGTIRLWEVPSGKEMRVFGGHQGWLWSVAWAPDGKTLASGGEDKTVRLWDAATGKELGTLRGHHGPVHCVVYAPDGNTLASAGALTVRLWNVGTGKQINSLSGHQSGVNAAVCSPDGKTVASGGADGTIRLWDVATCKELRTLGGHEGGVISVVYAPDGRTLMSGGLDKTIRLWDTATSRELRTLPCQGLVPSVVYAPDDKTPASVVSYGETLRLWDAATGGETYTLRGHEGWISAVAYAPDGKTLISVGQDKTMRQWETSTGRQIHAVVGLQSHMTSVAYAPNGRTMAFGSWDGTIRMWEVSTCKEIWSSEGGKGWMGNVVFSPDGKVLASVLNGRTIMLWDVVTGKRISSFMGQTTGSWRITFTPDGKRLISANSDSTVLLWDLPARPPVERHLSPELATEELNALWNDLKGDDAPRAYRAVWTLGAAPADAVKFFAEKVKPVEAIDPKRIHRLLADLGSDEFVVRETATKALHGFNEQTIPYLEETLKSTTSAEVRERVTKILEQKRRTALTSEQVRQTRAVMVLELIGDDATKSVLKRWAGGPAGALLTMEASAALERLEAVSNAKR
jgi:RNA polymerase sigma factor (sigma-70 family)